MTVMRFSDESALSHSFAANAFCALSQSGALSRKASSAATTWAFCLRQVPLLPGSELVRKSLIQRRALSMPRPLSARPSNSAFGTGMRAGMPCLRAIFSSSPISTQSPPSAIGPR
jgi:hypothetical protein